MKKNKKLQKNFLWNTIGSAFYSFTSLFFLVATTRINNIGEAGVFTFAFSNACVFFVLGSYAGRIFQITEKDKRTEESDFFYNRLLSVAGMVLAGIVFGLARRYSSDKLALVLVLIVFKAIEAFAEFYYAVIQKRNEIVFVGKSLTIKALASTAAFVIVDLLTKNIFLASVAMVAVCLIVLFSYDVRKAYALGYKRQKFRKKACMLIFKMGFLVFIMNILTQYLINAPKYAIDLLSSPDQQTIYGIVSMPATLMILVSNFLVHPLVNDLKTRIDDGDRCGVDGIIGRLTLAVIGIGALCVVGAVVFAVPVFNLVYSIDISDSVWALAIILIAASIYGIVFVLENVLIIMRRLKGQVIAFMTVSVLTAIMSRGFVRWDAIYGGAISYLVAMCVLLVLYLVQYMIATKHLMGRECDA